MKVSFNRVQKADVVDGVQVRYGAGRRAAARWRWRLVVLIAASPLLYFLTTMVYHALTVAVPGQVTMTTYTLVAPVSGIMADLAAKPGQKLDKNSIVAKIVDPQLETRLALLRSEADDLARRGEEARSGAGDGRPATGLAQALESARSRVANSQERLRTIKRLMDGGAATLAEYNEANSDYEAARVDLGQLEETLPYVGGRIRGEQLNQEIRVLQEGADLGTAVNASQGGQVVDIAVVNGQFIMQGAPIIELALPETVELMAYLPTKHLHWAEVGRRVKIRFDDGHSMMTTVSGLGLSVRQRPSHFDTMLSGPELIIPITLTPDEPLTDLPYGLGFRALFGFTFW